MSFKDPNGNTGNPMFVYLYSYNTAGRVTAQRVDYNGGALALDATYSWDNEGRMTATNYGPSYTFQFDVNGRLSGMMDVATQGGVASASYDAGLGVMTGLGYSGYNESRQFNDLLQMTRQTVATGGTNVMDLQYNFGTAGQNNGRIVSMADNVVGETVNYTYDALSRLTQAAAGGWTQNYTYDGFGNLTGKSAVGAYIAWGGTFTGNRQDGQTYDANGNLVGYMTGYDVENSLIPELCTTPDAGVAG